ncbi:aminodeoxychorismate/anthranilate synthase component II [Neisseriaceae bacterium CLB008]
MLLMIDNFDSFTYNIVQYLAQLGQEVVVKRHDEISVAQIEALNPDYLVIGPGPCSPKEAGISVAAIQQLAGKMPIMGICLGHQAIGHAFGGDIIAAKTLMHGKVSPVLHHNIGMFHDLPNPVSCTRYHSLAIDPDTLPACLSVTAWTEDGEIMGVRHKDYAIEGVQFHPEALLTEHGHDMLQNFLTEHQRRSAE